MCSRQRMCQKKRSTWQTVWNTNFTWKGSSQFPEISQLFWHGICSALEYGQEIARLFVLSFFFFRFLFYLPFVVPGSQKHVYPTSTTGGCRIHMFLWTWNNKWQIKQKPKTRWKNKQEQTNEIKLNKGFDSDVFSVFDIFTRSKGST